MEQNLIDKLYIISNNDNREEFKTNVYLYQEFYLKFLRYRKVDEKIYSILKTILKYHDLMDIDYCVSEILDALVFYQEKVSWQVTQTKEPSIDSLDLILFELKQYEDIKKIIGDPNYKVDDSINRNSINTYINSDIYVYYIDALMKILCNNYLIISKDENDEIMNLIYSNGWLNDLLEGKIKNSMLNRDLIQKYIQRILTIKEFVSDEELSKDKLVSSIIRCKIKDKKLLDNLFNYLNPLKLISIFDYDVLKLFNFVLDIDYIDDYDKFKLLDTFVSKCLNEDNYIFLFEVLKNDIIKDSLIEKVLSEDIKQQIIKFALNDSVKDFNSVDYLLDNNILDSNFISNSMMLCDPRGGKVKIEALKSGVITKDDFEVIININDSNDLKQQKIKKYNLTGRIIEYDIAINLLNKYLVGEIRLSIESVKGIVRSIITMQLNKNGINDVSVLFNNLNSENGSFARSESGKYISININQIEKFLDPRIKLENRFDLFITMFHEMRHAIMNDNMDNNKFDYNTYFMLKESIIRNCDLNYYSSNYRLILEEIDAREDSYLATYNFFKENFVVFEPIIGSIIQTKMERYDYLEYSEKNFSITEKKEYVSLIFDKIISMRPELIEKYPVLQLEYNLDGSVKDLEEIQIIDDYDMELIDQIIDKRYGDIVFQKNKK